MKQEGKSIIEIMAICGILVTIGGIALGFLSGYKGVDKAQAEQSMITYVEVLEPDLEDVRAICASKDSDMNGYVRCSASGKFEGKRTKMVAECNNADCVAIENIDR